MSILIALVKVMMQQGTITRKHFIEGMLAEICYRSITGRLIFKNKALKNRNLTGFFI